MTSGALEGRFAAQRAGVSYRLLRIRFVDYVSVLWRPAIAATGMAPRVKEYLDWVQASLATGGDALGLGAVFCRLRGKAN